MAITSQIRASVTHTKVAQVPDELRVTSLFSQEVPNKLWSNQKTPLLISPSKDNCTLFYTGINSSPIVNSNLDDFNLSSSAITFLSGCSEIETGCWLSEFDFNLSGSLTGATFGECGCATQFSNPIVSSGDLVFENETLSNTLSSICFSSFQEPLKCTIGGSESSFLPLLEPFDILDCNGNGSFFGNSQNPASSLLSSIFNLGITNEIRERTSNINSNISDIDLVDIEGVSTWSENLGCEGIDLLCNIPLDLSKPLKVASLDYESTFGSIDLFDCYLDEVGELLNETSLLSAGEKLFYQPLNSEENGFNVVHVPFLQNGLSSFETDDILSGGVIYPLSALNSECLTISENCFFRIQEPDLDRICNFINVDCLSAVPEQNEWCDIVERNLEFELLDTIFN